MLRFWLFILCINLSLSSLKVHAQDKRMLHLPISDYQDRVEAIWTAQIAAVIIGWPFEHKMASVEWLDQFPKPRTQAPVDDDWYYEMLAVQAFEQYGIDLSVDQLGAVWKEHAAGYWGSSEQARLLLAKGKTASQAGHPQYNKLWFTIGPQFSAELYGAIAPGMPNLAASIARQLCHINGYAEGADGGVFVAGMVSLGFSEKDPRVIVRKAASLIHPDSPYRQCLDMVIALAEQGRSSTEIFAAVEDRWHIEYPATNNAVANGGIVATSVWFGEGDFLKTVNLATGAADVTDADCNAANAAAVIGAMHGMKAIPQYLVSSFHDRIKADNIGKFTLKYPVDEKISKLAIRTAAIGTKILQHHGVQIKQESFSIPVEEPVTQPAELFKLSELTKYWNPDWQLERAGFGGSNSGLMGLKGVTYLDSNILATYPRDETRGLLLHHSQRITNQNQLSFEAGADAKKAWELNVYVNNEKLLGKIIEGSALEQQWQKITVDLSKFRNQDVKIRLYQRVLIDGKEAGNAYWKNIRIN